MGKRDSYWDTLKFVLIFLVVYGHVLAIDNEEGSVNRAVFNLIFCFHMPLFVFISGRFSQVNDEKRYKIGILRLAETYIVFQLLHTLRRFIVGKGIFTLSHFFVYQEVTMWYLLCLIYWRLIVILTFKYSIKRPIFIGAVILLSFAVCLISGFIPIEGEFSFQRACSFWPFFLMGYYSKSVDVKKILDKRLGYKSAVGGILAIFLLIYLFFNRDFPILTGAISYINEGMLDKELIGGRMLFIIAATALSAFVMRVVGGVKYFLTGADIRCSSIFTICSSLLV
mgnify:CR=1 FL=1